MADDAAFLQAVIELPNDDGPRLVYADWLDERGDPRGEFIRLQCRVAAEPGHPEYGVWLGRARELFRIHRKEWGAPFSGVARRCRFRRGFVESVSVEWHRYDALGTTARGIGPVIEVLVDLDGVYVPYSVISQIPESVTRECIAFPLNASHQTVLAAMPLPFAATSIERFGVILNRHVEVLPASSADVLAAMNAHYGHLEVTTIDS